MLFRLCNTLTTFQHLMQNTLGELNLTYCVIYLDDVINFGCTEKEHLECLYVVFERFREFNLKLKPSKCSFFQSEIIMDDVIIFGCTEEEHLEHLCIVFERFWEFNLKLKPLKCSFFQSEIIYLAHHVL